MSVNPLSKSLFIYLFIFILCSKTYLDFFTYKPKIIFFTIQNIYDFLDKIAFKKKKKNFTPKIDLIFFYKNLVPLFA